ARPAERVPGRHDDDIRVRAFGDEPAGAAFLAGEVFRRECWQIEARERRPGGGEGGAFTVEDASVFAREQHAAGAFRAGKEERVRRVFTEGEPAQLAEDRLVADDGVLHPTSLRGGPRRAIGGTAPDFRT